MAVSVPFFENSPRLSLYPEPPSSTSQPSYTLPSAGGVPLCYALEDVKKSIAEGKAIEALKQINQIDDKLLVSMSDNSPPMLDKPSSNDNK